MSEDGQSTRTGDPARQNMRQQQQCDNTGWLRLARGRTAEVVLAGQQALDGDGVVQGGVAGNGHVAKGHSAGGLERVSLQSRLRKEQNEGQATAHHASWRERGATNEQHIAKQCKHHTAVHLQAKCRYQAG